MGLAKAKEVMLGLRPVAQECDVCAVDIGRNSSAGCDTMPTITPQLELLDMDRPLRLCCEGGAWEHNVEQDRVMYRARVHIDGTPGVSSLCACDAAAADGESLLDPDTLKVRACVLAFTHLHGPCLSRRAQNALGAGEPDQLGACEGEALGACEDTLGASDGDALAANEGDPLDSISRVAFGRAACDA